MQCSVAECQAMKRKLGIEKKELMQQNKKKEAAENTALRRKETLASKDIKKKC